MNTIVRYCGVATLVAALVAGGFVAGSFWHKPTDSEHDKQTPPTPPGKETERESVKGLPQAPAFVANENRIKENLKEGKTYVVRTKGALNMRATDRDWIFSAVCTLNYAFFGVVERTIEKNDGHVIQELRHFKEIKSLKLESNLESARLELGSRGDFVLGGLLLLFQPSSLPWFSETKRTIENANLRSFLSAFGADRQLTAAFVEKDPMAKAFTAVGGLEGKKVRLVYRNDSDPNKRGVISVTPIDSTMTSEEKAFHFASSVLSDSLIFPDTDIEKGKEWEVDGVNFIGLIDPSLLAYVDGKLMMKRADDQLLPGRSGHFAVLEVIDGELTFHKADGSSEQVGYFRPRGDLWFSSADQIVVQGRLKGAGKITSRSKDHLLFEARSDREPTMQVDYNVTIQDGPTP